MEWETQNHAEGRRAPRLVEARRHPRFKLDVDIEIRARGSQLLRGRTVDISESGISAILKIEVAVGTVVQLDFSLPLADLSSRRGAAKERLSLWLPVRRSGRHPGRDPSRL